MTDPHPDAQATLDHLFALETAAQRRCDASAARITSGPLNALLLLHAATHRHHADRLTEAVVLLYGTPAAGLADTLSADAAGPGFAGGEADDDALIEACIVEDRATIEAYHRALEHEDLAPGREAGARWRWPAGIPEILRAGLQSNEARCRELLDAKAAARRRRTAEPTTEPRTEPPVDRPAAAEGDARPV
jgi:hypothetical protein